MSTGRLPLGNNRYIQGDWGVMPLRDPYVGKPDYNILRELRKQAELERLQRLADTERLFSLQELNTQAGPAYLDPLVLPQDMPPGGPGRGSRPTPNFTGTALAPSVAELGPLPSTSGSASYTHPGYPQDQYAGFPGPSGTPPVPPVTSIYPAGSPDPRIIRQPMPVRQPTNTLGSGSAGAFTSSFASDAGGGTPPGYLMQGPEMMPGASPGGGGPGFYDWITDKGSWDPGLTSTEAYGMNIAASLIPTHDQTRVFEGGGSLPGIGKGALIGGSVGSWPGAIIGGTLGLLGAFDTTSPPERSVTTWQRGQSPGFPNVPTASYFQGLI